jgi:hypothetical protein
MRFIVWLLLGLHVNLLAETLVLDHFRANVFSKADKKPVEVDVGLIFEGDEVKHLEYKVIDALNVVIGSYYAEDLVTSRGKELLKSTLIAYTKKVHSLTIDSIYIKELIVKTNPTTKEIVEAIKKEGVFQQQNNAPKQQQSPQLNLAPPLPKRSLIPEENTVNF